MSAAALFETTMALAHRIRDSTGLDVHIGAPLRREMGTSRIALTLVHIQPNVALRDTPAFRAPPASERFAAPAIATIPFDLRFLITCHRPPTPGGLVPPEPAELTSLGQIIRMLQGEPILTAPALPGQDVRVAPESCSQDEMKSIWGLFPEEPYRSSIVCRASPVYIDAGAAGSADARAGGLR